MKESKRRLPFANISALGPEIFKFEKWVKYANEMTDDVIHSTQYHLKHINRAILANYISQTPFEIYEKTNGRNFPVSASNHL